MQLAGLIFLLRNPLSDFFRRSHLLSLSIQFHAPVLEGGSFIGMRFPERGDHVADLLLRADHLQFPLRDVFLASCRTEIWI